MSKIRFAFLLVLLGVGAAIIGAVSVRKMNTPLGRTLAPLFSVMGRNTKNADRLLSRLLPIGSVDEMLLGDALVARRGGQSNFPKEAAYVNRLLKSMGEKTSHRFEFRGFVENGPPNAYALPGGVIVVNDGLFPVLKNEAQLVSILGHEIGHIERGHCFDSARFEILGDKLRQVTLGEIADLLFSFAVRHTFSKTQEQEADDYGFKMLVAQAYQPREMAAAFANLQAWEKRQGVTGRGTSPVDDYFSSHPATELRIENFTARAESWRKRNPHALVYVGARNFDLFIDRHTENYQEEATTR